MDELLKALTEAVRAGTTLAQPALIGYYIVRVFENVLIYPLTWGVVFFGIGRIIRMIIGAVNQFNEDIQELYAYRRGAKK